MNHLIKKYLAILAFCGLVLSANGAGIIQSGWTTTGDPAVARAALGVSASNSATSYITNLYSSNLFTTNFYGPFITNFNLYSTNIFTTNLFTTNLFGPYITNDYFYSTNIFSSNAYITNLYSSNAFITNLYTSNAFITNLFSSNAFITNLYTSNLFTTNLYTSNLYTTNFYATNAYITNLYTSNAFITNITANFITNLDTFITSNTFTTNLYTTNITAETINNITNISQNSFITNLTVNQQIASNITVQNITVSGQGFGPWIENSYGFGTNTFLVQPTIYGPLTVLGDGASQLFLLDYTHQTNIAGFNGSNFYGNGSGLTNLPVGSAYIFFPSQFQTNGGVVQITNIDGSIISGSITGMIYLASDTAAHIDATTPGLGLAEWAYDGNRLTMGDGATAGGVPLAIRYWKSDTNTILAGGRMGELAVAQSGLTASPSTNPVVFINGAPGTNWIAWLQVDASNSVPNFFGTAASAVYIHVANTNPAVSGGAVSGAAGAWTGPLLVIGPGNPGAGTVTGTTGAGGGANVFRVIGGDGGGVFTTANGTGGQGGGAGSVSAQGGKGGDANNGFTGGQGGPGGSFNFSGGSGSGDTVSGNGLAGGTGGSLSLQGANANTTTAGGSGGSITANGASGALGGKSAGTLNFAPATGANNRHGGSITTFGSSYAPMTIFTTTSTAGPNNTASATSLIGTAAFLAPVAGQNSGAVIASNVVNHAGRTLRFRMEGYIATNGSPTLELVLGLGGTTIIDTGAQTISSISSTQTWVFTGQVTFRTTGASGTCIGQGTFQYFSGNGTANSFSTANTTTTTIDTTKDESITCTGQFSTGNGCTLQCTDAVFELVN